MVQALTIVRGAVGAEHEAMLDLGEQVWQQYACERGYAYATFRGAWQTGRHPAWNKVLWLLAVLENSDVASVIWADADTLLVDRTADLAESIPARAAAMGWYESPLPHWNSGVIALCNDKQSRDWLRSAWSTGDPPQGAWCGVPGCFEQPALNFHAREFGVSTLAPRWHAIRTIGQTGGVIAGWHGEADRVAKMRAECRT
jgi:hypothetical protein